jgi:hypothetical protein
LSSLSKVLEKGMFNQLHKHLNKYSILAEEQFGLRTNSTTSIAIYKLINETLDTLNGKFIVGDFFNLEKAFDCLNHNIFLSELQLYGVNAWIESYLNNRYVRVQILDDEVNQTIFSAWEKIIDDVPQGSILGPLLFLIYVNDLPKSMNDKNIPILFADDESITVKRSNSKDLVTNMLTAFDCVNRWFK